MTTTDPTPRAWTDGTWGGVDFNAVKVLIAHQRRDIGSCLCGWGVGTGDLGHSHALYVWRELQSSVLPAHDTRVRGDPTPVEIEAGAEAFVRGFPFADTSPWPEIVERHPAFVQAARRAMRAVLPGHEARVRTDERARAAREILNLIDSGGWWEAEMDTIRAVKKRIRRRLDHGTGDDRAHIAAQVVQLGQPTTEEDHRAH